MGIEIRPIVESELDAYLEACQRVFGGDVTEGEAERVRTVIGLDRTHAAFDGATIVATSGAYSLELAVPGNPGVATAGLTRVTVSPTHRRQGILTDLIAAHFADAADHDEPLSALWASEMPIYGRFGYGPATETVHLSFDARMAGIRRPDRPDPIAMLDATAAREVLPALHEQARVARPGRFNRSAAWWELRRFPDHEWMRNGASSRRYAVAERDGRPVGYAMYRQKESWTDFDLPNGEIIVVEVVGIDSRAEHSLWWFLANIDLFPRVDVWTQPTDGILPWLAANPRAVQRRLSDGIHLRVLDVEKALTARGYDEPGEVVFELVDDRVATLAGVYRLTIADDGTAACTRSDDEPMAQLSAYALGSLYLGSQDPAQLAVAGHVGGDATAVRALRRRFAWPVAAWCDEVF